MKGWYKCTCGFVWCATANPVPNGCPACDRIYFEWLNYEEDFSNLALERRITRTREEKK